MLLHIPLQKFCLSTAVSVTLSQHSVSALLFQYYYFNTLFQHCCFSTAISALCFSTLSITALLCIKQLLKLLSRCFAFLSHSTTKIRIACSPSLITIALLLCLTCISDANNKNCAAAFLPFLTANNHKTNYIQICTAVHSTILEAFFFMLLRDLLCSLSLHLAFTLPRCCASLTFLFSVPALLCIKASFIWAHAVAHSFSKHRNYIRALLRCIAKRLTLLPLYFYAAAHYIKNNSPEKLLKIIMTRLEIKTRYGAADK